MGESQAQVSVVVTGPSYYGPRYRPGYYYGAAYTTIHSCNPLLLDGGAPAAGLTPTAPGVLLGTTSGPGTAYALFAPTGGSKTWGETPIAPLSNGTNTPLTPINAFQVVGTEPSISGYGNAFVLTNTLGVITKSILYVFAFGGPAQPTSGLLYDPKTVSLYGTASGGATGGGLVYRLQLVGGFWKPSIITTFTNNSTGGSNPRGELIFGAKTKVIFGTTQFGGNITSPNCAGAVPGCGVVFRVEPKPNSGEKILYTFNGGADGASPGGLVTSNGINFYGATEQGGNGQGTVYDVVWTGKYRLLYSFANTADGHTPYPQLAMDSSGALYGTAQGGGYGLGTAFVLVPPLSKKKKSAWSLSVLHSFGDGGVDDGATPTGRLTLDSNGTVYGVTTQGGAYGHGVAYTIVP